jgi:hypothetical protein
MLTGNEQVVRVVKLVPDDTKHVIRPSEIIASRKSQELMVAFAGPIGCGIDAVKQRLKEHLVASVEDVTEFVPRRTAYLIDQLKHPDEVSLLRAVYGNLFYLFGILSTSARREGRLAAEDIPATRISELVERDRKQPETNGQQLDNALQLADFFIRNDPCRVARQV